MRSRGLKYGSIAALVVFIVIMLMIAIGLAPDPVLGWIVIPAAIAIIAALVGIGIIGRKRIETGPAPEPIPEKDWKGQVTEFTPGNQNTLQAWWFTLKNEDLNPAKYIKCVMIGSSINGPPPAIGERFQIIKGKWKNSQVEAKEIRNLVTGAVTWV
jgi:hypothetical protein